MILGDPAGQAKSGSTGNAPAIELSETVNAPTFAAAIEDDRP